jgi:transmembrane 9 superfamily protein 3
LSPLQERGTILTAFIVCYALTSFVGGYVSGGLYARMEGGKSWIQCMTLTACLFPGIGFGIAFVLNTIAIGYGSLAAVPFGYIVIVLLLWAFLSFPLCIVGTIVGRNWNSVPNYPCRVKRIPSPIPVKQWYLSPLAIAAAGGLLPFGSIFIEMYFVFTSFWNYKVSGRENLVFDVFLSICRGRLRGAAALPPSDQLSSQHGGKGTSTPRQL